VDNTAPIVSAIAVPSANLRNTSAQITFTTDELAKATVLYGTTYATGCNYGNSQAATSYVLSQSVYLSNLTPYRLLLLCKSD